MRILCPHCADRTITRTSKRPSPVLYEVYAQCINPECGWGGKFYVECAISLSPSLRPAPGVRIPLDPGSRKAMLEQLVMGH
ncbi:ogr/Delta-like zinc finger family protein [Modicisalibacter sp. MOD 31.J]|uniref:ogr/Delta-like zinc finger family protein n=1 Tax=Modicisalibacter sp. MOD 31.J TaxID=2831897 RepID=UPI001CCB8307|nr:ogr/Delta-like zinc finger family protein [Modicisalibacter sp. MOD 31.J]